MAARKRSLNSISGEDAPALKMAKTNTNWRDVFEIEIKVLSKKKSSQIDRKPLNAAHAAPNEDSHEYEDENEDEHYEEGNHDDYREIDWLEPINESALSIETAIHKGKPGCVERCKSLPIRRSRIRHSFHSDMGEVFIDTLPIGFGLFDRYGKLKSAFKKGIARSDSGI